jgi:hypothetical protein
MKPPVESLVKPYGFSKEKLPRTLSYPLKRSLLDAALQSASVYTAVYSVMYVGRHNEKILLDAFHTAEQSTSFSAGRVLIRIWAVPRSERHRTEQMLLTDGMLKLCHWLTKLETEGNVWRGVDHRLILQINGGVLRQREE